MRSRTTCSRAATHDRAVPGSWQVAVLGKEVTDCGVEGQASIILGKNEAAEKLDFFPARSTWTYLKRLWGFGLLERRSRGRGTLEYRISDLGKARLRWLRHGGKLTN